jgi:adenosylcobinamide-GDP ribazoletransferase
VTAADRHRRPLAALRGAFAFLTRVPVGTDEEGWEAFRRAPYTIPLVGYATGIVAAVPFAVSLPAPTTAVLYLAALYLVAGVTHADGLADLGDAAAVHDGTDPAAASERRREVLDDSQTGVGGVLALGLALVGLALGALALAGLGSAVAPALVVAAEVGARTGVAVLVCLGRPAHDGLGSALAGESGPRDLAPVALTLAPLVLLAAWTGLPAVLAAAAAGPVTALLVGRWAAARLGGVSGDVFGAANELGRVAAVHAALLAWTVL